MHKNNLSLTNTSVWILRRLMLVVEDLESKLTLNKHIRCLMHGNRLVYY